MAELRYTHGVSKVEIQSWLGYWARAKMVDVDQICALDQVHLARKFCSCMRVGRFAEVGDFEIWIALRDMRAAPQATALAILEWANPSSVCSKHGSLEAYDGGCFTCDAADDA